MEKISFVLPLKINTQETGSDLDRVKQVLLPSIKKYFPIHQIEKFLIITISDETDTIKSELNMFQNILKIEVVPEENIFSSIPGWGYHKNLHRFLTLIYGLDKKIFFGELGRFIRKKLGLATLIPWYKQQLLKLCAANRITTDFYMVLDADVFLTKSVDMNNIFPNGKAIFTPETIGEHIDWWLGSARLLGINMKFKKEEMGISVTPEILSREVAINLMKHLIGKSKEKHFLTVFDYMASYKEWTEYTLYWLFLHEYFQASLFYSMEIDIKTLSIENSIWASDQICDQNTLMEKINAVVRDEKSLFIVLQSNSVNLREYIDIVNKYLY